MFHRELSSQKSKHCVRGSPQNSWEANTYILFVFGSYCFGTLADTFYLSYRPWLFSGQNWVPLNILHTTFFEPIKRSHVPYYNRHIYGNGVFFGAFLECQKDPDPTLSLIATTGIRRVYQFRSFGLTIDIRINDWGSYLHIYSIGLFSDM